MAVWKLTDAKCKSAKAGNALYKLFDGEGLYLAVTPSGGKHWRVAYRVNGKPQTYCMGPWERIPLKDARQRLDTFRANLFAGQVVKVKAKSLVKSKTFEEVSKEYWATRQDCKPNYLKNVENCLKNHIYPIFGNDSINQIEKSHVLNALLELDKKGKSGMRVLAKIYCSQVFDFSDAIGYSKGNPCTEIKSSAVFVQKITVGRAALNEHEVAEFLAKVDEHNLSVPAQACRFLALTALRTQEMRLLKWDQIKGDVAIIPSENMKMKKEHMVPLSPQALKIIENMRMQEHGSEYVFPNLSQLDKPVYAGIVTSLLVKLGYKDKMTGHGWRAVFSTWANDRHYDSNVIETILAHKIGSATTRAYNRSMYLPQRKQLLDDWANWLMPQAAQADLRLVG